MITRFSPFDGIEFEQLNGLDEEKRSIAMRAFARELSMQDTVFFLEDMHELQALRQSNNTDELEKKIAEIKVNYLNDDAKYQINVPNAIQIPLTKALRENNTKDLLTELDASVVSLINTANKDPLFHNN